MAGALVGGAFLSAFLQVLFDRLASQEIVDYFRGRKVNDIQLQKLKITLLSVDAVLNDAEAKQITYPAVKQWLDELKDAAYDAEDLLDEIATEALQQKLEAESRSGTRQVRRSTFLSPFEKGLSSNIEQILARLEFIAKQKDVLSLKEVQGKPLQTLPTSSLVEETGVYGRERDKEALIRLMLNDACGEDISVVTIVGMGGVGKTTLAQLVYNDVRVKEQFDLQVWIYVSAEHDIFGVTKTILDAVTLSTSRIKDFNLLQLELKEMLTDRKFLLVLDDVWNENYIEWEALLIPFKSVARGSKIIVTTRNERVASVMRSVSTLHLQQLSDEDCWLLFAKHAFDKRNSRARPQLDVIGKKIAKKCNGLPLAAKTLGCLLHSKSDVEEWDMIFKSNIWDLSYEETNILPALRLSYYYLPSHLKRCFAYCSIFPKNYEFREQKLIRLWMAEDLLQRPNPKKRMEKVGEEYFRDLLSRSFFQQSSYKRSHFVMHELINDLAKFVSGEFCCRMGNENSYDSMRKTRYISYSRTRYDASMRFKPIYEAKRLRTFLPLQLASECGHFLSNKVLHDLIPTLRCLRAISFSHYKNFTELPNSIGNLKHLRYLNLSFTSIKRLPASLCNLLNLQALILTGCSSLDELPTDMGRLINLRLLYVGETNLRELPSQISKLKNLQELSTFIVSRHDGLGIRDLKEFKHLQGKLYILELQNVVNIQDALEANLKDRKYLKELSLKWSANFDDSENERRVLENLQPCTNLERLSIKLYGGTRFPDWLGSPSFSNMVSVNLSFCKYCFFLPPLGQLPSLEELCITGCEGIERVGPEFYGRTSQSRTFRSLTVLKFENMLEWQEWISLNSENEGGAFPRLQQLYLQDCPKLTGTLPSYLPSLRKLVLNNCKQLSTSTLGALSFRKLETGNCDKLMYQELPSTLQKLIIKGPINYSLLSSFPLDLLPELQILSVQNCVQLASFSVPDDGQRDLAYLSFLRIRGCPNFQSFPQGGLRAPNLTIFSVCNFNNLISLPEHMSTLLPSLRDLYISNCPKLVSLPEGGLPSNLNMVLISRCDKLIANRRKWGLQRLPSLKIFCLGGCKDLESFPEEGLLPTTLTTLSICQLQSLRVLNKNGLQHLTSLQEFKIKNCLQLQSFPEERLPASLIYLSIKKCPLLKYCYQKENKEIWNRIAHIPCIKIDQEVIML
ncbi:hypothetical protein P3X46_026930 [Hevea brasiliensis]|uniref:Disease resistance RPP13-like protein 1 n=2 Tax=Hevea brasiliensis TaxID=3981 RepID=A0ABQ9KZQ0_HEVBR|nr:hypothetical protein P3X46_026930 [Hevea brasiliensis]